MAIEGAVFDVSGTLLRERYGTVLDQPQPNVEMMLGELKALGLKILAASNNPVRAQLQRSGLSAYIDHVVERSDVGVAKRSPAWVVRFQELTELAPNQLLYVGDSDNDMITATRGPMIYAHAVWSTTPGPYGLQALSPAWVVNVVRHIFRKQHPWYWTLSSTDGSGRAIRAMTLIDGNGAGSERTKQYLLNLLKDDIDTPIRGTPMTLKQFVMLHMLASVYDSNLFGGSQLWTTCPGHSGTPNTVMGEFLDVAAKLSRNTYKSDLLVRHTIAMKSKQARDLGGNVGALRNQLDTMQLGAAFRRNLPGKRVLLLDNFLTWGYSTEGGRTLLLQGGASEVVVACVGKYGQRINVITASAEAWDAFGRERPDAATFPQRTVRGDYHQEALTEFVASLEGIHGSAW